MATDPQIETVSTTCVFCGKEHLNHLPKLKVQRWRSGESIQYVFPEMTPDEREILISGTCPACWDLHMIEPEEG